MGLGSRPPWPSSGAELAGMQSPTRGVDRPGKNASAAVKPDPGFDSFRHGRPVPRSLGHLGVPATRVGCQDPPGREGLERFLPQAHTDAADGGPG